MGGGPTVIHVDNDNDDGTPCRFCGTNTTHTTERVVGKVTIAWSCCLLFTTVVGVCIPCFFCDNCKDVDLKCIKCQQIKNTIPANCC